MKCTLILAALFATILRPACAADCSPQADEVNARCYASLQDAVGAALATERPLVLPRGTYSGPLVIDYSSHAGTGFELISRGATINGTLTIQCSSDCFYFHQEGTLFVTANVPGYSVTIGKPDFSDAHNSIKLDHLVVNNSGPGGAVQLNYVLNADIFVVADTAGDKGLALEQTQFSTIRGAMSAGKGAAVAIENGYSFANTLTSLDLEASLVCRLITSTKASYFGNVAPYTNCPTVVATTHAAWNSWINTSRGISGMTGGAMVTALKWLD